MLASNLVCNSLVLKHNRHGLALVPSTSFCTLLRGYLNITPISLFHYTANAGMLASNFVDNSPVLKQNIHVLELVPTTSFCSLLWGYVNVYLLSTFFQYLADTGLKGRAMLTSNFVYNSPVLKHNRHGFSGNPYKLILYLALKLCTYISLIYLFSIPGRHGADGKSNACFKFCL
jgi:hypothetical protein